MGSTGSQRLTLKVEGMDCANCALGITRKLTKSGDHDVHVDFTTGEASFSLAPHRELASAVKDIENLGYRVVGLPGQNSSPARFTIVHKFWFSLVFALPLMLTHVFAGVIPWLEQSWVQFFICLPVFLLGAYHFGKSAIGSIRSGIPNMDVLIVIGAISSFGYSLAGTLIYGGSGHAHHYLFYETTASIITLVLLGNLLEQKSVKKTSSAIDDLAALLPEKIRRIITIGKSEREEIISPDLLHPGDIVQVNAGESFPADGNITTGSGSVNESMISGESSPVGKIQGSFVIGGSVLLDGPVRFVVTRSGQQSTLALIIESVKAAQREKPPVQKLADKISAWFVPIVLIIALATFLIERFALGFTLQNSIMNAIAVLVISCPCAMGLATPTAVMVGIGRAARQGILIRSGKVLEQLNDIGAVVFDKTGTITTGHFKSIQLTVAEGSSEEEIRSAISSLEKHSSHPLAISIIELLGATSVLEMRDLKETKGVGISGKDQRGNQWTIGSWRITESVGSNHDIYVLRNTILVATADLEDEIKPGVQELIHYLKSKNIRSILLSGDRQIKCDSVAKELGITEVFAEQLPEQKLKVIEELSKSVKTVMIGDGINDAPALAKADIGISLSDASKAALNSAQVIVPGTTSLLHVKQALLIGSNSMKTIKQNLFWAFFYNALAIPLAAAGYLSPMIAALSMAFSDIIVIGNSLRLRNKKLE